MMGKDVSIKSVMKPRFLSIVKEKKTIDIIMECKSLCHEIEYEDINILCNIDV